MATKNDTQSLRSSQLSTFKESTLARSQYRCCLEATGSEKRNINVEKENGLRSDTELTLRNVSLSPFQSFLEKNRSRAGMRNPDMYSSFMFDPVHRKHLGFPKILKECLFSYL